MGFGSPSNFNSATVPSLLLSDCDSRVGAGSATRPIRVTESSQIGLGSEAGGICRTGFDLNVSQPFLSRIQDPLVLIVATDSQTRGPTGIKVLVRAATGFV